MRGRHVLIVCIQIIVAVVVFIGLQGLYRAYELQRLHYDLSRTANSAKHVIAQKVEKAQGLLASFATVYELNEGITVQQFDALTAAYLKQTPEILYIQHKNADTITDMVYPKAYNYTLGATLMDRPEVKEAVEEAISRKLVTANDPFILKNSNGLLGLVIRQPLFKDDKFVGFFVAVLDVNKLVKNAVGASILERYQIQLSDSKGEVFWGSKNDVIYSETTLVKVLDNHWRLRVSGINSGLSRYTQYNLVAGAILIVFLIVIIALQMRLYGRDVRISELRAVRDRLEKVQQKYRLALDSANDAIWEWDIQRNVIYTSEKWLDIAGYSVRESDLDNLLPVYAIHKEDYLRVIGNVEDCLSNRTGEFESEFRVRTNTGDYRWVQMRGKGLRGEADEITILAGSLSDIDERRKREDKIHYLAYTDSLTGLANKAQLTSYLEKISRIDPLPKTVVAIDIDNFKTLNDTYGLEVCDQLLVDFGQSIVAAVGELGLVARFGGDEFVVAVPGASANDDAGRLCKSILEHIRRPHLKDGQTIHMTASIGAVVDGSASLSASDSISYADFALLSSKEHGRNQYSLFDHSMRNSILRKSEIESALKQLVIGDGLELHCQPQRSLINPFECGVEVLARMYSPTLGPISPLEFIPEAERTGLIVPLGERILHDACRQAQSWISQGINLTKIAVNVSVIQLLSDGFVKIVGEALESAQLPASILELEITESALFVGTDHMLEVLKGLKELGVTIALDDFGTGYSSFSYLTFMPIDALKIDRTLVKHCEHDEHGREIIKAIIKLAHNLRMNVIAEGVETQGQHEFLSEAGCDSIQGYFIARPMSILQTEEYFKTLN